MIVETMQGLGRFECAFKLTNARPVQPLIAIMALEPPTELQPVCM